MDDALSLTERNDLVRRGLWLNYAAIIYNVVEAVVSLAAGLVAGSVALVGFGIDSVIEVTASGAAQWRLRSDLDATKRERVERRTHRVIGWSFIALAAYVLIESAKTLWLREEPDEYGRPHHAHALSGRHACARTSKATRRARPFQQRIACGCDAD